VATTGSAVRPGAAVERDFALTALQHLRGPAQRPFLELLKTLPPRAKQPGVVISTKTTKNMSCSGGVCTPIAANAVLNVSDLTRLLGDGSVTIGTTAQAPDILVNAPFSWVSANGLTLQAIGNIVVNKAVSDAGPAPLTLTYNATGAGGALSFGPKGHISFLGTGNPLIINGQSYILANNIQLLAQLIARNPAGSFALSGNYNARQDGKYAHSPISSTLLGNLEGLGNTISGLRIEDSGNDQTGFLQQIGGSGYAENLNLKLVKLTCDGICLIEGGFVADNQGSIFQVGVDGTIDLPPGCQTFTAIGGVAGINEGIITFSHATGLIDGDIRCNDNWIGGLIGKSRGNVDHSYAGVSLSLTDQGGNSEYIGGLIGIVSAVSTIDETFATGASAIGGSLHTSDFEMGGLIGGMLFGSLSHSSASGAVSAQGWNESSLGGLVGDVEGDTASVEDGVATGAVSNVHACSCGGAIGLGSNVADSVSFGTVFGGSGSDIGGFIGYDDKAGPLSNDGWCTTSSGITDPSQGAGNIPNDAGIAPFTC
jgi:hypothetical protein